MGRLALSVGLASLGLLAACNMLSGADGLVTESSAAESDVTTPRTGDAAGSSGRDHAPPTGQTPPMAGSSGALPDDDAGVDAASEAAAALPTFTDDFNRGDGTSVGDGWVEKTFGKFPLVTGASQQSATGDYHNLFVSRPASENVTDVLVQATVMVPSTMADPCLFARIQTSQSSQKDHFVGYSLYPDGPSDFYISRDDGTTGNGMDVGYVAIAPALVPGTSYRMSFQVTGANPVHLVGSISQLDGTVVASITTVDANAKQITAAGSVGYGSSSAQGARFDDFRRVTLDK